MTLHADELSVDEALVGRMICEQLPAYAGLPVRRLSASGSSNALFRLGADLLVRLPRQRGGSSAILKERRWLPYLDGALPVRVPQVVAVGQPAHGYPEQWSVVRWLDGEPPEVARLPPESGGVLASDLVTVLLGMRELAVPPEAAADPALRWYRGEPLIAVDAEIRAYADQCRSIHELDLDIDAALRVWDDAVTAAAVGPGSSTPRWLHGDLLAENLLVRNGRLVAVLDFGSLAIGDPTVDLAWAWELLDAAARTQLRTLLDLDDRTWILGRAWALAIALMTFPYYWSTMPGRCADRLTLARQVLSDAGLQ